MRPQDAEPVLDDLMLGLGRRFAQIRFESLFAVSKFASAHQDLMQISELTRNRPPDDRTGHRFRHMWAAVSAMDVRIWPPGHIAIGAQQAKDDEFLTMLSENLNNQHLWLLVQAFEEMEAYYKDFYGALGYLDDNIWLCSDYGTLRIPDISTQTLQWFQVQTRRTIARHSVDGILNQLRRVFPQFQAAESNQIDLALWFDAAAFFRHMIVHGQARIAEAELIPNLAEATGHSFTGPSREVAMRNWSVVSHFELKNGFYVLWLIGRDRLRHPYHNINDKFDSLLGKLASHAALSYATALTHFGRVPFWERNITAPTTPPTGR